MIKLPAQRVWFDTLSAGGVLSQYAWIARLLEFSPIEAIADFGCCSAEPFFLLWLLDATKVCVIEQNPDNLLMLQEDIETLDKKYPESMRGRSVEIYSPRDMSQTVTELTSNHFDLAYCERVLYTMSPDLPKIQRAINEMARVVRPGGFVITVDEQVDTNGANERGHPFDLHPFFGNAELIRFNLPSIPDWSYCYQKPNWIAGMEGI